MLGSTGADEASGADEATLSPARLGGARRGSVGLGGTRCVVRAPGLRRALSSAPLLLAGSGAEGGPSYPDVRSPELSGGGGEAARAAITRETAPSCHQPSVLLLSGGVPGRDSKGVVPPGGTWKPQVGAAGTALSRALQIHPPEATLTRLPPTTHKHAWAHSQAHKGTSTRPRSAPRILIEDHLIQPLLPAIRTRLQSTKSRRTSVP